MLSVSSGAGGEGDCGVVVVGDRGHGGHGGGLDRAAHTAPLPAVPGGRRPLLASEHFVSSPSFD